MVNKYAIERLQYLIEHYMETRSRTTIISTAKVAKALTTLMTVSPLSNRALEDAIAEAAVRHGHVVQFDFSEPQHNRPEFGALELSAARHFA